jgi:hypothetical protein
MGDLNSESVSENEPTISMRDVLMFGKQAFRKRFEFGRPPVDCTKARSENVPLKVRGDVRPRVVIARCFHTLITKPSFLKSRRFERGQLVTRIMFAASAEIRLEAGDSRADFKTHFVVQPRIAQNILPEDSSDRCPPRNRTVTARKPTSDRRQISNAPFCRNPGCSREFQRNRFAAEIIPYTDQYHPVSRLGHSVQFAPHHEIFWLVQFPIKERRRSVVIDARVYPVMSVTAAVHQQTVYRRTGITQVV